MGRVWVKAAEVRDGRLERLEVRLGSLPVRVLGRETTVAWMRDQHSFVTEPGGVALQLVEIDDGQYAIRTDNQIVAEDSLPGVPTLRA
jgi:hypothetical protein